jgi:hypothetical protein
VSSDRTAILEAIRALPRAERVRLVEELTHDLADEVRTPPEQAPRAIIGLFSDEPELIEEVCRSAMAARERDRLRVGGQ